MNRILAALFSLLTIATPYTSVANQSAIIDRIEGNYAVVEFSTNEMTKVIDISTDDINGNVKEGLTIPVEKTNGTFYCDFRAIDCDDVDNGYYQFRSNDDKVWWALTEKEIGFIPKFNKQYTLYYSDNNTTKENPPCDCPAEYDCECFCYDDLFFAIIANK